MAADAVGGVWVYAAELACSVCEGGQRRDRRRYRGPATARSTVRLRRIHQASTQMTDRLLEWMDGRGAGTRRAGETLLHITQEFQPHVVHADGLPPRRGKAAA